MSTYEGTVKITISAPSEKDGYVTVSVEIGHGGATATGLMAEAKLAAVDLFKTAKQNGGTK